MIQKHINNVIGKKNNVLNTIKGKPYKLQSDFNYALKPLPYGNYKFAFGIKAKTGANVFSKKISFKVKN